MCRKKKCKNCGKWCWVGCGEHIEQALKGISKRKRCECPKLITKPPWYIQSQTIRF